MTTPPKPTSAMQTRREIDDILVQEYLTLQKTVEDYDSKALTIKAWSVTLSAAGIVTAYIESNSTVLLIASLSALVFWLLEALWKANQQAYYPRILAIETHFADPTKNVHPLGIGSSWSEAWRNKKGGIYSLRLMWWSHVMIPHIVIAVTGVALYVFAPPN